MTSGKFFLCVGVSPTIQRTLSFARFELGGVNRVSGTRITSSGKATNVCRILHILGSDARLVGFVGSSNKDIFVRGIDEDGLDHELISIGGDTRFCQTLLVENEHITTEIVEESPRPGEKDWRALDQLVRGSLPHAEALLLSGKLPPGSSPNVYARWIDMAREMGIPSLLDTQIEPLRSAILHKPFLVKVNMDELISTFPGDEETVGVHGGIKRLLDAGVSWVLVTRGHRPALLAGKGNAYRYNIPKAGVVNPIGSGDAVLAGIAHSLSKKTSMRVAVQFGLACGTANTLTDTSGCIDPSVANAFVPDVTETCLTGGLE